MKQNGHLPDFLTGLEMELRLGAAPFDRGQLETFAAYAVAVAGNAEVVSRIFSMICSEKWENPAMARREFDAFSIAGYGGNRGISGGDCLTYRGTAVAP